MTRKQQFLELVTELWSITPSSAVIARILGVTDRYVRMAARDLALRQPRPEIDDIIAKVSAATSLSRRIALFRIGTKSSRRQRQAA